jgi:hypothetical protein
MFGAKAQIAVLEKGLACEVVMVPFDMDRLYEPKHREVMQINPKPSSTWRISSPRRRSGLKARSSVPGCASSNSSPNQGRLKRLIADRATTPTTFVMISRQAGPSPSSPVGVRASARSNMTGGDITTAGASRRHSAV